MSKFTGLKKGLVGVCAATLLTGVCAAPAFAATGSVDTNTNSATGALKDQSATTNVGLDASQVDLQISATVPQNVNVAIDNTGALVLPTDNVSVKNTSTLVPLVLKTVAAKEATGSPITLVSDSASLTSGQFGLTLTSNPAGTTIDLKNGLTTGTAKIPVNDGSKDGSIDFAVGGHLGSMNSALFKSIVDANATGTIAFVEITWTVAPDTTA